MTLGFTRCRNLLNTQCQKHVIIRSFIYRGPNMQGMSGGSTENRDKSVPVGPACWKNWRAKRSGDRTLETVEVPLFSDAWFIGTEAIYGPYRVLNTLPYYSRLGGKYEWKPAIQLRMTHHVRPLIGDLTKTDDRHYHGGGIYDEIAALLALVTGARIVAGSVERTFGAHGDTDPMGRPSGHSHAVRPSLPARTDSPTIPALFGDRRLTEMDLFGTFADLSPKSATVLVKSARSYQQALWLCDTSPEISWLLMISAVETAAGCWKTKDSSPVQNLTDALPGLVTRLRSIDNEQLLEDVAKDLSPLTGSTTKFLEFMTRFSSDLPENRPSYERAELEGDAFRSALNTIYKYRSRALHGGTPFPHPMCQPPDLSLDDPPIYREKPMGLATGSLGATWVTGDTPMLLHVFAHAARAAILGWWQSMVDLNVGTKPLENGK